MKSLFYNKISYLSNTLDVFYFVSDFADVEGLV